MKADQSNRLQDWLQKANTYKTANGLQLLAKKTLAGAADGLHKTAYNSDDFQFSQFRKYNSGDDVRLIDWKTYAKTDKFYIKQSTAYQQVNFRLIPDLSLSMTYSENDISKIDYLKYLLFLFANIANNQNDNLYYFDERKSISEAYFKKKVLQLEAKGTWQKWKQNYISVQSKNQKSVIIYLSDLYEYDNEMLTWLKHLQAGNNEVFVFQIMGENEMNLSFTNKSTLKDLETNETVTLTTNNKKQLQVQFEKAQLNIKQALRKNKIEHQLIFLGQDPTIQLNQFLKFRNRFR